MAMINCSECGESISDKAASCPHCGAPVSGETNNTNQCPKCNTTYIAEQKNAKVSPILFISLPMFLGGILVLLFNWIFGLLIIGLAFVIDTVGRKKKTVLICPKCRYEPY